MILVSCSAPARSLRTFLMRLLAAPVAVAAILAGGCGTSSPTSPTMPPPPSSALVPGQALWNRTATFTGLSGPATCFGTQTVGTRMDWVLYRSGNDVILQYSDEDRRGSTDGETVRASQRWPGFFPCGGAGGARVDFDFESAVAGRFSPDGSVLTARKTWTYRLSSGEQVVFSFGWVASRR